MSTELVNVAVPVPYLTKVYGFIASLDIDDAPPEASTTPPPSQTMLDEWTPDRIDTMVRESQAPMRGILAALAESPGEWLTSAQLAAAISPDADWNTVAGTLGAFGRRCYSRYQLETLPFEKQFKFEAGGKVHRMPAQIAQEVLQVLGARQPEE